MTTTTTTSMAIMAKTTENYDNYNNYDNYGIKNTDKNCTVSDKPFSSKLLCLTYLTKAIKQLHLEQVMQLNLDF